MNKLLADAGLDLTRILLGLSFAALVILVVTIIIVGRRDFIRTRMSTIPLLRRSVRAHEAGVYNGCYGGART